MLATVRAAVHAYLACMPKVLRARATRHSGNEYWRRNATYVRSRPPEFRAMLVAVSLRMGVQEALRPKPEI